ncbi:aminopeptidase N [Streptomyces sp. NPDC050508]|uniref:aminopeptidase N n=1 Tax=Streptomyces sp. NPDC050508 TaxID=3155405 RepID=UPI00341C05B1
MPSLTRAEAEARARLVDVERYTVDLDLTRGETHFRSATTVRFTARTAGDTFAELKPAVLHRAALDGHVLDPALLTDGRIPLRGLTVGPHELYVEADMAYSRTGEGLHRLTDPADGETYVHSQAFLDQLPRITVCFDQPDLKAVFEVTVAAPPSWTVLGNGVCTCDPAHEGRGRWRIAPTPPISTYLFALAAGPWHSLRTEHAGLPFGLHCRRSLAPYLDTDVDELWNITCHAFDRYHELFDEPYPFDSYDQVFVPEFTNGAMENPGLVAFRESFLFRSAASGTERQNRARVIAHEMAHMWFGDLVTMRWWDDLWLNESFADHMAYQLTGAWTEFAVTRKTWGYDADQRASTHPVAPPPDAVPDTGRALANFDGIAYAKGAAALRQLATWLGEKPFLAGVNDHLTRHRFGNATLDDLLDSLTRASGRDVHAWGESWLRTTGVDTIGGQRSVVSRPHRVRFGLYDYDANSRLVLRERIWTGPGDTGPGSDTLVSGSHAHAPALLLPNDGDLTYAKVRLDTHSWAAVTASLSTLDDPLTRAVLWTTARDMVRDAELPPVAYLHLVTRHLPYETDAAVVDSVLAFARGPVADRYLAPELRPASLIALADVCRGILVDPARQALHLGALRTLVDSAVPVPEVPGDDHELRWHALFRRCVLGAADEADIANEAARDRSSAGGESAARCRAALPDPAAKEAAWRAMFESDGQSATLLRARAQGFWQPEQTDLLAPYVPRWFPAATDLAARQGPTVAATLGRYGFPAHTTDPAVLAVAEHCLAHGAPVPALRRWLTDQCDDLRRAMSCRAGTEAEARGVGTEAEVSST